MVRTLNLPPRGLFVTGTDTEAGKTYVSTLIVKGLVDAGYRVGVYKPAASGCVHDGQALVSQDALALWNAAGQPLTLDDVCPQRFRAALAPHLAARIEGKTIDTDRLRKGIEAWSDQCDIVIVEGLGGLMSPVSDQEYVADLAIDFGYPLVVVARNMLGVINQTMLTLIAASCFRDGLQVAGIILNDLQPFSSDSSQDSNLEEISRRSLSPVLGRVHYQQTEFHPAIDWFALSGSGNKRD
ncbi:MAG TPA: dethiobiotin synthase [Pirellulaceae bacterium]|nr:dethiobiotin synthase [Pirellulaceae bacterium]